MFSHQGMVVEPFIGLGASERKFERLKDIPEVFEYFIQYLDIFDQPNKLSATEPICFSESAD